MNKQIVTEDVFRTVFEYFNDTDILRIRRVCSSFNDIFWKCNNFAHLTSPLYFLKKKQYSYKTKLCEFDNLKRANYIFQTILLTYQFNMIIEKISKEMNLNDNNDIFKFRKLMIVKDFKKDQWFYGQFQDHCSVRKMNMILLNNSIELYIKEQVDNVEIPTYKKQEINITCNENQIFSFELPSKDQVITSKTEYDVLEKYVNIDNLIKLKETLDFTTSNGIIIKFLLKLLTYSEIFIHRQIIQMMKPLCKKEDILVRETRFIMEDFVEEQTDTLTCYKKK